MMRNSPFKSKIWIAVCLAYSLSGCATYYNYTSTSSSDATIVFGDELPFHGATTRIFSLKQGADSDTNLQSFQRVGQINDVNLIGLIPRTISIKVKDQIPVMIFGAVADNSRRGQLKPFYCHGQVIRFVPETAASYSIDMTIENMSAELAHCTLYVHKVLSDGSKVNIESTSLTSH